MPVAPF